MNPLKLNKTATTKFILPMLFESTTVKYNKVLSTCFINAYVADFDKPEWDDHIIVARTQARDECLGAGLIDVYESDKDTLYIHTIPEGREPDYYEIIAGNYSAISEEYKKQVLNFWDKDDESDLYKVLYKRIKDIRNKSHEIEFDIDYQRVTELYPQPKLAYEIYNMGEVTI